ncbi:MAG TPA: hypothetical protein VF789_24725 [Thermoanaerobaculia bacterium]
MSRKPDRPQAPHVARAVQAAMSRPGSVQPSRPVGSGGPAPHVARAVQAVAQPRAARPAVPAPGRLAPHVAGAVQSAGRQPGAVQPRAALPARPVPSPAPPPPRPQPVRATAPVIQRMEEVAMDLSGGGEGGEGGKEPTRRSSRRLVPSSAHDDFRRLLHAKLDGFLQGGGDNPGVLDNVAAAFDPPDGNGMVSRNCSAVCTVAGQSYIAWNSPKPGLLADPHEADPTRLLWRGQLQAVGGADSTKHAEMKLLDATNIAVNGGYIGLSKAGGCCPLCASVMAIANGVTTRGRHTNKPTNWKMPEWLKTPIRICLYLGSEMVQSLSVLYPDWLTLTAAPSPNLQLGVVITFHQGDNWGRAILEIEDAIRRWL